MPAPLRPAMVSRSRRSSLSETPRNSGEPEMSFPRSEAMRTATSSRVRGRLVSYDPRAMRRLSLLTAATVTIVLAAASPALADMSGQGWYGETTDKVVTNFGFILIAFFPLFIFVASLIYWQDGEAQGREDEGGEGSRPVV